MKISIDRKKDTQAALEISASSEELAKVKQRVLKKLAPRVKIAGFRDGKAPLELIEKSVDQQLFQTEFIDEAINLLYIEAIKAERLRPVGQPKVEITKFVPFTDLEVKLEVPVVGKISLPNYKKLTAKRSEAKIETAQITQVIENLRTRSAEKKEVNREAKVSDEAWIDFKGVDAKGEAIAGADGKDYPLVLGSNTFIPGFEDNVVGMKIGESKDFKVTFPKDYGSKALRDAKVTFTVTLNKVKEVVKPKLDDKFASTIGPFKTVTELKGDIKKQLEHEAKHKLENDYDAAIVEEIIRGVKVAIPEVLVEEQKDMVLNEVRQNVIQRGITYDEYLKQLGVSEDDYLKGEITKEAERRIKAGLVLNEIADIEGIDVAPEELEARIQALKGQYKDAQMQAQLDTVEARRELSARLRSEKVIKFLKTQG